MICHSYYDTISDHQQKLGTVGTKKWGQRMNVSLIVFCKACKYNYISEKMNAKALLVPEISSSKGDIWVCMENQITGK